MENHLTVLICDDSLLIRKKLRETMEKLKFKEIYEAENGVAAIEQVKQHNPDIVFLDIVMPDKDGIEALKGIKEVNPDIKVIMVSSVGTSNKLKEALENGAHDFVQKPINFETITKIVENILKEG
ncbi:MAG: response regulator [Lysinibacillus sp.]|nr:response regulator [Lysinibacillus sp.]